MRTRGSVLAIVAAVAMPAPCAHMGSSMSARAAAPAPTSTRDAILPLSAFPGGGFAPTFPLVVEPIDDVSLVLHAAVFDPFLSFGRYGEYFVIGSSHFTVRRREANGALEIWSMPNSSCSTASIGEARRFADAFLARNAPLPDGARLVSASAERATTVAPATIGGAHTCSMQYDFVWKHAGPTFGGDRIRLTLQGIDPTPDRRRIRRVDADTFMPIAYRRLWRTRGTIANTAIRPRLGAERAYAYVLAHPGLGWKSASSISIRLSLIGVRTGWYEPREFSADDTAYPVYVFRVRHPMTFPDPDGHRIATDDVAIDQSTGATLDVERVDTR